MRKRGIGLVLPLFENAAEEAKASSSEDPEERREPMRRAAPLKVECEGKIVHASSKRMVWHATIGEVYEPAGNLIDKTPKTLLAVGLVGEEWQVSIGPATGERGRSRGMHLVSFLKRYVKGTPVPRVRRPERVKVDKPSPAQKEDGDALARIEAKLDLILAELGVKSMPL